MTDVPVSQEAREVVADYGVFRLLPGLVAEGIRAGRNDGNDLVQALANRPTERALVEAARAVERHLLTEMPGMWGNAPGHGHKVVGIWDRDPGNGDKGGTACEWCAQWDAFRAALKAHGETVA